MLGSVGAPFAPRRRAHVLGWLAAAGAAAAAGLLYGWSAYALDPLVLPLLLLAGAAIALGAWRLEWGVALLLVLTPFAENAELSDPAERKAPDPADRLGGAARRDRGGAARSSGGACPGAATRAGGERVHARRPDHPHRGHRYGGGRGEAPDPAGIDFAVRRRGTVAARLAPARDRARRRVGRGAARQRPCDLPEAHRRPEPHRLRRRQRGGRVPRHVRVPAPQPARRLPRGPRAARDRARPALHAPLAPGARGGRRAARAHRDRLQLLARRARRPARA